MKKLISFITFFCITISLNHSDENIQSYFKFEIQKSILDLVKEKTYPDFLIQEWLCITQIKVDENKIHLQFGLFDPIWAGSGWEFNWFYSLQFQMDRKTGILVFINCTEGKPQIGQQIQNISIDLPEPPLESDPSEGKTNLYLDIVALDSQKKKVGGLIRWESQSYPPGDFYSGFSVLVWDAETGKQLFNQNYPHRRISLNSAPSIKIEFSPHDRFLVANEIFQTKSYMNKFNVCLSASALVDTKTMQFITTANRDVAFTSDERYYCTYRGGAPSLVDSETHELLYQYKLNAMMTACCFTPDNQKLYIACEDLNIYEFDSHVPQSSVRDWEIYGKN